jgi:hypothetical protein
MMRKRVIGTVAGALVALGADRMAQAVRTAAVVLGAVVATVAARVVVEVAKAAAILAVIAAAAAETAAAAAAIPVAVAETPVMNRPQARRPKAIAMMRTATMIMTAAPATSRIIAAIAKIAIGIATNHPI